MHTVKYIYWEEDGAWLGYLQDFPDYWTQGETLDDFKEHLRGTCAAASEAATLEIAAAEAWSALTVPYKISITEDADRQLREQACCGR